jgi:hypothetical protein
MKVSGLRIFAFLGLAFCSFSCTGLVESTGINTSITTPTPTYNCEYFENNRYDNLASCQSATGAACQSETDTFPNGAVTTCYFPPAGFAVCSVTPPTWDWIYSTDPWCDTGTTDSSAEEIYKQPRNLIGCSSAICTCNNPQVLTVYCAGDSDYTDQDLGAPNGTTGCANYPGNPAAAPVPSATPIPTCL